MTPLRTAFLNNSGLVSNDTVFERIDETKNLKLVHLNPFSYRYGVIATGPKKLISFLLNYFVFQETSSKIPLKLFGFTKTSYAFSNSDAHLLIQR